MSSSAIKAVIFLSVLFSICGLYEIFKCYAFFNLSPLEYRLDTSERMKSMAEGIIGVLFVLLSIFGCFSAFATRYTNLRICAFLHMFILGINFYKFILIIGHVIKYYTPDAYTPYQVHIVYLMYIVNVIINFLTMVAVFSAAKSIKKSQNPPVVNSQI